MAYPTLNQSQYGIYEGPRKVSISPAQEAALIQHLEANELGELRKNPEFIRQTAGRAHPNTVMPLIYLMQDGEIHLKIPVQRFGQTRFEYIELRDNLEDICRRYLASSAQFRASLSQPHSAHFERVPSHERAPLNPFSVPRPARPALDALPQSPLFQARDLRGGMERASQQREELEAAHAMLARNEELLQDHHRELQHLRMREAQLEEGIEEIRAVKEAEIEMLQRDNVRLNTILSAALKRLDLDRELTENLFQNVQMREELASRLKNELIQLREEYASFKELASARLVEQDKQLELQRDVTAERRAGLRRARAKNCELAERTLQEREKFAHREAELLGKIHHLTSVNNEQLEQLREAVRRIDALGGDLDAANTEISRLKQELRRQGAHHRQTYSELKRDFQKNMHRQAQVAELHLDNVQSRHERELAAHTKAAKKAQREIRRLTQFIAGSLRANIKDRAQIQSLQEQRLAKMDELHQEKERHLALRNTLESALAHEEAAIRSTTKMLHSIFLKKLARQREEHSAELGASQEKIHALEARLAALNLKSEQAQAQVAALKEELHQQHGLAEAHIRDITKLKRATRLLLNKIKIERAEFLSQIEVQAHAFEKLFKEKAELEKRADDAKRDAGRLENELNEQRESSEAERGEHARQLEEANGRAEHLERAAEALQQQLDGRQRKLQALTAQFNSEKKALTEELQGTNQAAALARRRVDALEIELRVLQQAKAEEVNGFTREFQEKAHTIERLQEQLQAARQEATESTRAQQQLQIELAEFQRGAEVYQGQIAELRRELDVRSQALDQLRQAKAQQVEESSGEISALQERLEQAEAQNQRITGENIRALEALRIDLQAQRQRAEEANGRVEVLQAQIKRAGADSLGLRAELESAQEEAAASQIRAAEFETLLGEQFEAAKRIQARKERKISALRARNAEQASQIERSQAEASLARESADGFETEIQSLKRILEERNGVIKTLDEASRRHLNGLNTELDTSKRLSAENIRMAEQLRTAERGAQELQLRIGELEMARKAASQRAEKAEATVNQLSRNSGEREAEQEEQLGQLRAELAKKTRLNARQQAELEHLRSKQVELEEDNALLTMHKEQYRESAERIDGIYVRDIDQLKSKLIESKHKLRNKALEAQQASKNLNELQVKYNSLEREWEAVRKELGLDHSDELPVSRLRSMLEDRDRKVLQLQEELAEARKIVEEQQNELVAARTVYEHNQMDIRLRDKHIGRLQSQIEKLQGASARLAEDIEQKNRTIAERLRENEALQEKVLGAEKLQSEHGQLKNRLGGLLAEKTERNLELRRLQEALRASQTELQTANDKISRLRSEHRESSARAQAKTRENAALRGQIEQQQVRLEAGERALHEKVRAAQDYYQRNQEQKLQIAQLVKELRGTKADLVRARKAQGNSSREFEQQEAVVLGLRERIDQINEDHAAEVQELREALASSQAENHAIRAESEHALAEVRHQMQEVHARMDKTKSQNDALQRRVHALEVLTARQEETIVTQSQTIRKLFQVLGVGPHLANELANNAHRALDRSQVLLERQEAAEIARQRAAEQEARMQPPAAERQFSKEVQAAAAQMEEVAAPARRLAHALKESDLVLTERADIEAFRAIRLIWNLTPMETKGLELHVAYDGKLRAYPESFRILHTGVDPDVIDAHKRLYSKRAPARLGRQIELSLTNKLLRNLRSLIYRAGLGEETYANRRNTMYRSWTDNLTRVFTRFNKDFKRAVERKRADLLRSQDNDNDLTLENKRALLKFEVDQFLGPNSRQIPALCVATYYMLRDLKKYRVWLGKNKLRGNSALIPKGLEHLEKTIVGMIMDYKRLFNARDLTKKPEAAAAAAAAGQ